MKLLPFPGNPFGEIKLKKQTLWNIRILTKNKSRKQFYIKMCTTQNFVTFI